MTEHRRSTAEPLRDIVARVLRETFAGLPNDEHATADPAAADPMRAVPQVFGASFRSGDDHADRR